MIVCDISKSFKAVLDQGWRKLFDEVGVRLTLSVWRGFAGIAASRVTIL